MKKTYRYKDLTVVRSEDFDDIAAFVDLPFPLDRGFIDLLKKENKFFQEYFYIKRGNDFAFFIVYNMKLNILTFGKCRFDMNVKVVGIPCSVSEKGYYTNNEQMMVDFIKTFKGVKIILNTDKPIICGDTVCGETLPTLIFKNDFKDGNDYLNSLRSSYRRRLKKAIKKCENFEITKLKGKCSDIIYDLYLQTYEKSSYKLEKLDPGFFDKIDGEKLVFSKDGRARGFVLLKRRNDTLYFIFCGMDYNFDTADLYHYMLYKIIIEAINNKIKFINFGQTSEETKLKIGATLSKRYFCVHHSNIFINKLIKPLIGFLEYRYRFEKFRVFKDGDDYGESIVG